MKISIDIPDSIAAAKADQRYFQEAFVAMLYKTGDLSSKEACEILAVSRRQFEEMLPRFGVSILPDDRESVAIELNA